MARMDRLTAFEAKHMYDEVVIDEVNDILEKVRENAKNHLHIYWHKMISRIAAEILTKRDFELTLEENGSTRISWKNA